VLDLFSGIGGFSLGLERAGMQTVAFCEIEPFCRAVLRKHWPAVPIYEDIRTLTADRLAADGIAVDLICGGFPCQDISVAGKGAGIDGERSGLWSEYARIIGEIRPRYAFIENVSALLGRGFVRVLGDLATLGYDAEWHCIPASAVGAPHRRDRIWIVGYADCGRRAARQQAGQTVGQRRSAIATSSDARAISDSTINGRFSWRSSDKQEGTRGRQSGGGGECSSNLANTDQPRLEGWIGQKLQECASQRSAWQSNSSRQCSAAFGGGWWLAEPAMGELVDGVSGGLVRFGGRVAKGVPNRVQKLRALGNAVVPQIPELIGRAIMEAEA
jgi:DNA (cytosine-5)-methyltransferase 1